MFMLLGVVGVTLKHKEALTPEFIVDNPSQYRICVDTCASVMLEPIYIFSALVGQAPESQSIIDCALEKRPV
jgi:hypothetical protein